ncbi:ankyrin repeat domain protein [Wolbachia endosymbiont of Armadillidium vulgare str. wVulC]|uniref:ankyrin repeat domain-containing protein n=1 Tax=Wolbachia endosymbiont of Armadillidium vulgare TaxID=77039 RepID=UPI00064A3AAD|nr:ankyrin repeat domain-containing protein [Wolbachia endosymbiont of Armadillidium vulgare]KLT22027.1 ankyrin repeat domain protein [Wolbachia endosymbiont of Armadillidium vulgare str. wVulC]OJH31071.1 Ankyrin repeats (3 copies) [Wolbachia endosymbiont of Armadillidium vulgare]OJH33080.1 Ankyrin repeats (3 copies) [Wolbachia endosymbiont of Armadillidium vulgare]
MTTLVKIINNQEKKFTEKIKELQEYLTDDREIVINKTLFTEAIVNRVPVNGDPINRQGDIVYPILHHCIKFDNARSEKGDILPFQNVMNILDEAVHKFITPEYFYGLINFQGQSGNTLLHQAVISNNTEAIEALLKYGANPLMKDRNRKIPLDLAEGKTREVLIKCMKDQAKSKKESAKYDSLFFIMPVVYLGIGLGFGGASIPSMTLCAIAVSALIAGIALGVAMYFLSQDYKQATSIESVVATNSYLYSAEHEKIADNGAALRTQQ